MSPAAATTAVPAAAFRPGTVRGTEGFFRAAQDPAGRWWLMDPAGAPFFLRGVHGLHPAGAAGDRGLPPDPAARLRNWGFNAIGAGGSDGALRDDGLPFLVSADFFRVGRPISGPGVRLPDVFDPHWAQLALARAQEICPPLADNRQMIGWITDDHLDWAHGVAAARPSLLQICLSLEPGFPAYHAAWEFVLALHGGRLDALAHAWSVPMANKEVVRELTRTEQGLRSRGYLRDEARWAREFARRYFAATAAALRAADPNHLVLGCRFRGPAGPQVLAECAYPKVDVALPHWSELPAAGARPSHPVIASDVSWVTPDFLRPVTGGRGLRLTTIERMAQRARAALKRLAHHPAVAGYVWSQWQDEPGEQPPFARGLVHPDGTEAREHTELLAQFNARAEALRRTLKVEGSELKVES